MIARVIGVTPGGFWRLKIVGVRGKYLELPTFCLPKNVRYTDDVRLEHIGHPDYALPKVTQIVYGSGRITAGRRHGGIHTN